MLLVVLFLTSAASDDWIALQAHKRALTVSKTLFVDVANGKIALCGTLESEQVRRDLHAQLLRIPYVTEVISFVSIEKDNAEQRHVVIDGWARNAATELVVLQRIAQQPDVKSVESRLQLKHWSPVVRTDADAVLARSVKLALAQDARLPTPLYVDVRDQVVKLWGYVASDGQREAAINAASHVPGVVRVRAAMLTDSTKIGTVALSDEQLQSSVQRLLANDAIAVAVRDGIVELRGKVASRRHKLEATLASRRLPGVRAVQDDLQVVR